MSLMPRPPQKHPDAIGNGLAPGDVARAEAMGEGLPALLVAAEQVAATVAQGVHGRRRVGTGEAFWQYRPHGSHDSANTVDWRRSARSDDLFVRETEWEASQSVWVWTDRSPSMAYASANSRPPKADRAMLLMLAACSALLRGGERVGLIGMDRRASGGRAGLKHIVERLITQAGADLPDGIAGLPPSVDLPRHCQGLIFSDFLGPVEDWERRFAEFSEQRIGGLAVQVLDPAEETLPFRGRARFEGLEGEGDYVAEKVESLRPRYRSRLEAHRDALRHAARSAGWELLVHHTDRPAEQALMSIYVALARWGG